MDMGMGTIPMGMGMVVVMGMGMAIPTMGMVGMVGMAGMGMGMDMAGMGMVGTIIMGTADTTTTTESHGFALAARSCDNKRHRRRYSSSMFATFT
jgi:hypothetical protein